MAVAIYTLFMLFEPSEASYGTDHSAIHHTCVAASRLLMAPTFQTIII